MVRACLESVFECPVSACSSQRSTSTNEGTHQVLAALIQSHLGTCIRWMPARTKHGGDVKVGRFMVGRRDQGYARRRQEQKLAVPPDWKICQVIVYKLSLIGCK